MSFEEGNHVIFTTRNSRGNKTEVLGTIIGISYRENEETRYFVDITRRGEHQTIVEAAPGELQKVSGK